MTTFDQARIWILTVSLFVDTPRSLVAETVPAPDITSAEIIAAIRNREERTRSGSFHWDEIRSDVKGSWGPGSPQIDLQYRHQKSFEFDRNRTRRSDKGESPNAAGELTLTSESRAFDGTLTRTLESPTAARNFYYGRVYNENDGDEGLHDLVVEPLLQSFYLFHSSRTLLGDDHFSVSSKGKRLGDVDCVVISTTSGSMKKQYWFDPLRDFAIVRFAVISKDDALRRETDFTLVRDESVGFVPSGWSIRKFAVDGTVSMSIESSVTKYATNVTFSDADFVLDFPDGTYVDDLRDQSNYIIRSESNRPVLRDERIAQVPYERLRDTEPGQEFAVNTNQKGLGWFFGLNLVLVVAAFLYYTAKHRSK